MTPLGRRVVVKPVDSPEKIGSIYIPYQLKPQRDSLARICDVVAVGTKVQDERLKPGVRVIIAYLMPIQVFEKEKLLVVPEEDINAILED